MAVRPQHMHDGGIMERRLRPIYDWLDHSNNKKALQEAEKVLKKSPSLQAARALKALALFRLGKGPEAQNVLDALAEEKPSDDTTLQAMTISYRESQQLPKVCTLYEAAVKAEPTSEELHSHLFMSYVRVRDYHAQQRAAMALYKFAPKNPYYFWAVMSIVLQAKATEDSTKKGILLTLAQRMIDNFIAENKMEAEQEAQLYIMILELKDKWDDILKFIEGPLYSQLVPGSNVQTCIPYLKKLGHWKRLNSICKELLLDNPDRWDFYLPYFDSVFHLMKEGGNYENIDDTAEKCHEFICQLVEGMSSGKTLRGPYLARLELWRRLADAGEDTSLLGSGVALCVQYLRVFAHKPCAVPDLRTYLEMIPQKDREENCRDFLTCLGFDENSELETMDDIQRHISCHSAWRITAAPLDAEACLTLATTFRRHYLRSLHQGLVTATVTEFCAPDGYGLLAAHHYFYAAIQQSSSAPLVEAACVLELVLHHSPSNFHAKLLLVRLYHLLGNALAADTIYQRLEVKHIQLLSLGWLHTAALGTGCAFTRALQLLADTNAFHTHHAKDSVEHLTYAYKYGTFSSLVSLYDWNERLECCAFSALCSRERALLALLAGPLAVNAKPQLKTNLTDNRDLNVIVNWEPPQLYDKNLKSRTFEEDLALLRLKDGLVSSVSLCIELSESRPQEEKRQQYDELVVCLDAFGSAMEKCKERYCERGKISLSAPFPSRLVAFVNSKVPYRELYTSTLRLVGEVCVCHTDEIHALCERLSEVVGGVRVEGSGREGLEEMAMVLEYIGVVTLALGLCNDIATSSGAKKSKRKTNQSPADLKTIQLLNKLNGAVQKLIADIEKVFKNWPREEFTPTLESEMSNMFNNNKYQSPVLLKLKNGHNDMVNDVKNILNKKTKYLKSLQ